MKMKKAFKLSNEVKVGLLIVASLSVVLLCGWVIGIKNPFNQTVDFYVTYHFAGGIENGSPVRVAGIKVGKVEKITFFRDGDKDTPPPDTNSEVVTPLRIKISISKEAAESVRADSKFFINLAGIIGERYIEITPGTYGAPKIVSGEVMRGIDPPRIDQLISQSFNLAGELTKILEDNKGDITKSIKLLYDLSNNFNKTIEQLEKSKFLKTDLSLLINNLIQITGDMKTITAKTHTAEGQKTLDLLYRLLWRLEDMDKEGIRRFFQKEGIRTRLF